jgi:hypothetical protein
MPTKEGVRELSEYCPDEDLIEHMESVVQTFKDEILELEWTRTICPDPDAETRSDPAWEPMGEDLLDILEEILVNAEAAEGLELGPVDNERAQQALWQATKVSGMGLEVFDDWAKADWQLCACRRYPWLLEQKVRWLNDKYGGLEEEEASVRTRKRAWMWLVGAHKDVECTRNHICLHLQRLEGGDGRWEWVLRKGAGSRATTQLPAWQYVGRKSAMTLAG